MLAIPACLKCCEVAPDFNPHCSVKEVATTFGPRNPSPHIPGVAYIQSTENPAIAIWAVAPASQKTQAWVKSEPQGISQK